MKLINFEMTPSFRRTAPLLSSERNRLDRQDSWAQP